MVQAVAVVVRAKTTAGLTIPKAPKPLLTNLKLHLEMQRTLMPNVCLCHLCFPFVATISDKLLDGGYQNYVALWYQSLMQQQQQQNGDGAPAPGA